MKILLFSKSFDLGQLDDLHESYNFEVVRTYADSLIWTSNLYFKRLQEMANEDKIILTLYPDMLQLKAFDSQKLKESGSDIRLVNNLEEAMLVAKSKRRNTIVFPTFAFENLTAATAAALIKAKMAGIRNFKIWNDLKSESALLIYLLEQNKDFQAVVLLPQMADLLGRDKLVELSAQYHVYFATSDTFELKTKVEKLIQNVEAGDQRQLLHSAIRMKSNAMIEAVISEVFDLSSGEWESLGEIVNSKYLVRGMYADHQVL